MCSGRLQVDFHANHTNRPRYQYSSMAPRPSGQTSIFGVVFFVPAILIQKPRSHVRILIYQTSLISYELFGERTRLENEIQENSEMDY